MAPERNDLEITYLGDYSNLETVMSMKNVVVMVGMAPLSDKEVKDCLDFLDIMGKTVTNLLDDIVKVSLSRPVDFDGLSLVAYDGRPNIPEQELVKRKMDVISRVLAIS